MRYILILCGIAIIAGCQDNEPCTKTCETIDLRLNEESCTCECGYTTRWDAVKINDRLCAGRGSYVALVDESYGPNLDTFIMTPPSIVNELNPMHKVLFRMQNCYNGPNGGDHNGPDSYYASYSHGDSLILDWMDAPDCSFDLQSSPNNDLWRAPYRLKFNGFLPDGYESDSLYVKLEYLNWAHNPVHEPAKFVMFKVK